MAYKPSSRLKASWKDRLRLPRSGKARSIQQGKAVPSFAPGKDANSQTTGSEQPAENPRVDPSSTFAVLSSVPDESRLQGDYTTNKTLLWDDAYLKLKSEDPKLIEGYEGLLQQEILDGSDVPDPDPNGANQMELALNRSLERTAKLDKVEARIRPAIDIVLSVKATIGTALSSVPIAAAAWTPICITLQIFSTSFTQAEENRNGVIEIVKKMKWYSSLSLLLLEDNFRHDHRYGDLLNLLKDRIRDLYKALLTYMIETIRTHKQNFFSRVLKGLVSDWKAKMTEVTDAEKKVTELAEQCRGQQTNAVLQQILNRQLDESQSKLYSKLYVRNMDDELESLLKRKDPLIPGSHEWIVGDKRYKTFVESNEENPSQVLWIKGEAGMGKTMLIISLIQQLNERFDISCLSYFFCQETDNKLNTAINILKGLIWMLLRQNKSLMKYLEKEVLNSGEDFLDDDNAFPTVERIFLSMLQDSALDRAILLVDALDECQSSGRGGNLSDFLGTIQRSVQRSSKVKWIVSGRPISTLNDKLAKSRGESGSEKYAFIEVNRGSVAEALKVYIDQKISDLRVPYLRQLRSGAPASEIRQFTEQNNDLDTVAKRIREKTDGTFLWAALVFRELAQCEPSDMVKEIDIIPQELKELYGRILRRIRHGKSHHSYARLFLVAFNARRPLALSELLVLSQAPRLTHDSNYIENSGLLTVREGIVYFVHQSAKDHLAEKTDQAVRELLPRGLDCGHGQIAKESLKAMSEDLPDNGLESKDLGTNISQIESSEMEYLQAIGYSCVYWLDHFCNAWHYDSISDRLKDIQAFFQKHLLQWIEALALLESLSFGLKSIIDLKTLLESVRPTPALHALVDDIRRFVHLSRDGIEVVPGQVYSSALLFCPTRSAVRKLYNSHLPSYFVTNPKVEEDWDACLQAFPGNSRCIAFNPDGNSMATSSGSNVRILNFGNGSCSPNIAASGVVSAVAYSSGGEWLAIGTVTGKVEIWDATSSTRTLTICTSTTPGGDDENDDDTLAHDNEFLSEYNGIEQLSFLPTRPSTIGVARQSITLWNSLDGSLLMTIVPHDGLYTLPAYSHKSFEFSSDGRLIAIVNSSGEVEIHSIETEGFVRSFAVRTYDFDLSADSERIAVLNESGNSVLIWKLHATTSRPETILSTSDRGFVRFSPVDSQFIVVAGEENSIEIWNITTGTCIEKLIGRAQDIVALEYSPNGRRLASASGEGTVRLWEPTGRLGADLVTGQDHDSVIQHIAIAPRGDWFVSNTHKTIKIWNMQGNCLHTLLCGVPFAPLAISASNEHFASMTLTSDRKYMLKVWKWRDGQCSAEFEFELHMGFEDVGERGPMRFSPKGDFLAAADKAAIVIVDIASGSITQTINVSPDIRYPPSSVAFSSDGQSIIVGNRLSNLTRWSRAEDTRAMSRPVFQGPVTDALAQSIAFSNNGALLAIISYETRFARLEIWDLKQNICLQQLEIPESDMNGPITELVAFEGVFGDGPQMRTNRGTIVLPHDSNNSLIRIDDLKDEEYVKFEGPGLTQANAWITWHGRKLLWLPPIYRSPKATAVQGNTVVIGCVTGRILVLNFKPDFDPFPKS